MFQMDFTNCKHLRFFGLNLNSLVCKCIVLVIIVLVFRAVLSGFFGTEQSSLFAFNALNPEFHIEKSKFLEVPQIIWGLNNQKIAFARACLTARTMNRTLLMPSLSVSLFYKEVDLMKPISFDKVFQFEKFNSMCKGFIRLARYSEISNRSDVIEMEKGSGRKWTAEKDLDQLKQFSNYPYDEYEVVKIVGKNPFLWHDHWPVKDYAKIFECLFLVEEISREAEKVISKIREIGLEQTTHKADDSSHNGLTLQSRSIPYIAVHMRIEKDWIIHCKKREQRSNITEICSSKEEIMQRVGNISGLKTPTVVYLAVADDLLEDDSILSGWGKGLFPFEKKKLGFFPMYSKYPYLIQSAIDYEVCVKSDVFIGNSFSTFSSLVVLDRTQKMISMGDERLCGIDVRWPSFAYNLAGDSRKGPRSWATNMSETNLEAVSYGSNRISCH